MMQQAKPVYKLRSLIYKKYGSKNFAVGCEIVARWVAFDTKQKVTQENVLAWCNATAFDATSQHPTAQQFSAISLLFGLKQNRKKFLN